MQLVITQSISKRLAFMQGCIPQVRITLSSLWSSCRSSLRLSLLLSLGVALPAHTDDRVGVFVSSVFDESRAREIAYTLYYPEHFAGVAPVLLFSHGGTGSTTGHTRLGFFGTRWAAAGYVGIHLNHLPSSSVTLHRLDRPLDVSFLLDRIQAGTLPLPAAFEGTLERTAFGHSGHSFGAYTSMALAGGDYPPFASFRDPRIVAVAPVSPQGPDQFGAFDDGPDANTWAAITVPAFNLVGGDETDTNAIGTIEVEGWRLVPFLRYPEFDDKFQAILPGRDHLQMGEFAPPGTQEYLGENTRLFFDVYLRGEVDRVCDIGTQPTFPGQALSAKSDPEAGLAHACPPPIGLPEPSSSTGLLTAIPTLAWLARRSRQRKSQRARLGHAERPGLAPPGHHRAGLGDAVVDPDLEDRAREELEISGVIDGRCRPRSACVGWSAFRARRAPRARRASRSRAARRRAPSSRSRRHRRTIERTSCSCGLRMRFKPRTRRSPGPDRALDGTETLLRAPPVFAAALQLKPYRIACRRISRGGTSSPARSRCRLRC